MNSRPRSVLEKIAADPEGILGSLPGARGKSSARRRSELVRNPGGIARRAGTSTVSPIWPARSMPASATRRCGTIREARIR